MWAVIRRLRRFTVKELADETRSGSATVRDYVDGLFAAGYLGQDGTKPVRGNATTVYVLVRDVGVDAPRVRKDGTEVTQGRGREQMWLAMRILKEFSAHDLAISASTEETPVAVSEAQSYVTFLHKAKYLALVRPHTPGKAGVARYRLLPSRYTGPRPPMIQRVKQVYDPNLKKVVWSQGGEE